MSCGRVKKRIRTALTTPLVLHQRRLFLRVFHCVVERSYRGMFIYRSCLRLYAPVLFIELLVMSQAAIPIDCIWLCVLYVLAVLTDYVKKIVIRFLHNDQ